MSNESATVCDDDYDGVCWGCGAEIDTNRQHLQCVFCAPCAGQDLEKEEG